MQFKALPLCLLATSSIFAVTWDGTNNPGDWNTAQNWNPTGIPSSNNNALFNSTGSASNTIFSSLPDSQCQVLQVEDQDYNFEGQVAIYPVTPSYTGLDVTNATATFTGQSFNITNSGTCALTVKGGALGTFSESGFFIEPYGSFVSFIINGTGDYYFNNSKITSEGFASIDIQAGSITVEGGDLSIQPLYFSINDTIATPSILSLGQNLFNGAEAGTISAGSIIINGTLSDNRTKGGFNATTLTVQGSPTILFNGGGAYGAESLIISGGTINLNPVNELEAFLDASSLLSILGNAKINNSYGTIGYIATKFAIKGQAIINNGTPSSFQQGVVGSRYSFFANNFAPSCTLSENAVVNNFEGGLFTPVIFTMDGGTLNNSGIVKLGIASINGGTFSGTGTTYILGTVSINSTISQGLVEVIPNRGFGAPFNTEDIMGGVLRGTGTINAPVNVYSTLYPGQNEPATGALTITGDVTFKSDSILKIDIVNEVANQLNVVSANLIVEPGAAIFAKTFSNFSNPFEVLIATIDSIDGNFSVVTDQVLIDYTLKTVYPTFFGLGGGPSLVLQVTRAPFLSVAKTHNQKQVAKNLDQLNLNTNACLQDKIDQLQFATSIPSVLEALTQMQSSELKALQVSIEEVLFQINDDLKMYQYDFHKGYRPFVGAALNYQKQTAYNQYPGFLTTTEYEYTGLTYGKDFWQILGAIASTQARIDYKKVGSKGSNVSGNVFFGFSAKHNRWLFGFDSMGGYNRIHTHRDIDYYDLKAKSSHNMWNFKTMFHSEYLKTFKSCQFSVYDDLTYYYGKELGYTEYGASCLSLDVEASSRNILRNALGVKGLFMTDKNTRPYLDLAYVYEDRLSGLTYSESFVNTTSVMKVRGYPFTHNLAKLNFGLMRAFDQTMFQLNFSGLYGHHYFEQAISLALSKKF